MNGCLKSQTGQQSCQMKAELTVSTLLLFSVVIQACQKMGTMIYSVVSEDLHFQAIVQIHKLHLHDLYPSIKQ